MGVPLFAIFALFALFALFGRGIVNVPVSSARLLPLVSLPVLP